MSTDSQIMVYLYTYWDDRARSMRTSTLYATMTMIRDGLGMPVYESGKWVPIEEVQGGIHRPAPTKKAAPHRYF
jgi:hypothetical protein